MKRTDNEIMNNFLDLACALSPENLNCDGEASSEEVESSLKSIKEEWKKLEKEIGREITESDAWDWHRKNKEIKPSSPSSNSNNQPVKNIKKNFFGR